MHSPARRSFFLVTVLVLLLGFRNPQAYRPDEAAVADAEEWCAQHGPLLDSACKKFDLKKEELLAVVFPEMTRYAETRDKAETSALELLYKNFGAAYANFSIGRFQMKPAFIEQLEQTVNAQAEPANFQKLIAYGALKRPEEIRGERVRRLGEARWQIVYLCCWYKLMERQHKEKWSSAADKVSFFAAAYNCGSMNDEAKIRRWERTAWFPYGASNKNANCCYAALAKERYLQSTPK